MRKTAAFGTVMVLLATATNLVHAVSHVGQHVLTLEAWQWAYVICVIYLAPIVATVLLWTPYRLAGAWLGMFWGSSVLLVAVSGLGTLVGGWAVVRISRSRAEALSTVGPEHSRRASRTEAR